MHFNINKMANVSSNEKAAGNADLIKNTISQSNESDNKSALTLIYNAVLEDFPETVIDESAGYIDFHRQTNSNLTIFTITVNNDKLSLSFNCSRASSESEGVIKADEEILNNLQKTIMNLSFYLILEFYEEHENLRWKHEVYKIDRVKRKVFKDILDSKIYKWGKRQTVSAKVINFFIGILMVLYE